MTPEERVWRGVWPYEPGAKLPRAEYLRKLDEAIVRARNGEHLAPLPVRDSLY